MASQETFLRRLRRHRERAGVTLDEIAEATRVRRDLFEALEQGDLSSWPKGLYTRAWVRAYAEAVGLDGAETVDEFCRLFAHGDRRVDATMRDIAAIIDVPPRFQDDEAIQGEVYGRRASDRVAPPPPLSFRDRVARAARIVADIRHMRDLPTRLAQSWRTLRPSRPTF